MIKKVSEESWFIELCDEIILMLDNDEFNYTNSIHYNNLIAKLLRDYGNSIISYNQEEEKPSRFFDTYTQEEKIALNIFRDLLKESNDLINIDISDPEDKAWLESYFNKISSTLASQTFNDVYSNTPFPITSISNPLEQNFLYQKDIDRKDKIKQNHYRTINFLESQDLKIWKDQNKKLFYRPKAFEKEQKINKADIEDITNNLYVKVYDSTEDVQVIDAHYIIISLIPTVRKDIFNPFTNNEFIFISNNLYDRNKFEYTKLLEKRLYPTFLNQLQYEINDIRQKLYYTNSPSLQDLYYNQLREKQNRLNFIKDSLVTNDNSFIEQFLRLLFQNEEEFYFFIAWLSSFFYLLKKSNIALVLIGDDETTDTIMDFIIKPIFIKNKNYLSTITNSTLDKESENEKLLEDKIFYHINNLSSKTDTKRVSRLSRSIVKPNHIILHEAWENDEQHIYGELLVTASKESPYPYLKDILSSCSVFRVRDIESVLNKLDMDYSHFEKSMINDLYNFTNKLIQYAQNNYYLTVLNTDEKTYLSTMKNGVLITPKVDRQIDCFIEDIFNANINAFHSIKLYNQDIYNELIYNFEEGMIAQSLLSKYFNIIHQEKLIPDNNEFIKILREKVKMYNETPTDKSKYNGKKRYKIFRD